MRARIFSPEGFYLKTMLGTTIREAAEATPEGGILYIDDTYFRVKMGMTEQMDADAANDMNLYAKAVAGEAAAHKEST